MTLLQKPGRPGPCGFHLSFLNLSQIAIVILIFLLLHFAARTMAFSCAKLEESASGPFVLWGEDLFFDNAEMQS
jgi:hypothetical protein